jgi:hypothetical protein
MLDQKICSWLLDNADAPIRYRTARELLQDGAAARKIEPELFDNSAVKAWLKNLKPQTPPQYREMEHGSFDFLLENALPKVVRLGLHGGMPQVRDALGYYIDRMHNLGAMDFYIGKTDTDNITYRKGKYFCAILTANMISLAGIEDEPTLGFMLGSLDELYRFADKKIYDIYLDEPRRKKLTKVPKNWKNTEYFIKPELLAEYGFSYPLIYDVMGLHRLYSLKDPAVDAKISGVIDYITSDEFHAKISSGYGILVEADGRYHGMGWDPKYPGWFDLPGYMEHDSVPKLLFFAEYISKYPSATKTKWFRELLCNLEKYRTESGTYLFPAEWLGESQGYAVGGHHMSLGENRHNNKRNGKNWREIESTFYAQLLNNQ